MFFDEFSVTNRPSLFYGWARINTRPVVPSCETGCQTVVGLLSIDASTGKEIIRLVPTCHSFIIADYFYDQAVDAQKHGHTSLTVIIDNNGTHKDKMRYYLWLKLHANPDLDHFAVQFIDTPKYSPEYNLAEYSIHLIRQSLLHHLPAKMKIAAVIQKIEAFFASNQLQTTEQIHNTINHILKLGGVPCMI